MSTAATIAAALILAAMWSILCRFNQLQRGVSRLQVALHHAAIGIALPTALVLPPDWAVVALAAGVWAQLLMGARRWRHGAPPDTRKAPKEPPP